ncbi:MAG TPA: phosphatase [Actinomycetota bacterium]|nr:phosphatase [Actinomycetota bacterium]
MHQRRAVVEKDPWLGSFSDVKDGLVTFPDGTSVRACGVRQRAEDDEWREFGLYMDPIWDPTWESETLDWPDFGVPAYDEDAVRAITEAFGRAKAGAHVEIGCIGGLGRTGTVLACMSILAGVPPEDAVQWVRKNYLPNAVENPDQVAWVKKFAALTENRR